MAAAVYGTAGAGKCDIAEIAAGYKLRGAEVEGVIWAEDGDGPGRQASEAMAVQGAEIWEAADGEDPADMWLSHLKDGGGQWRQ